MKKALLSGLAGVLLVGGIGVAHADTVSIDLVENPGANDITLDLADGSPQTASVTLAYAATNTDDEGDGSGCNLTGPSSQVTFPIEVTTVSGTAPTLDATSVQFTDCNATRVIGISATEPGVINVSLGTPTSLTTNKSGVTTGGFDTSGAAFSVTVVDSTQVGALDAPEIANAYLAGRDNGDCKESWGTNKTKANWHGQLISAVAKKYQGQTFTESTKHVVEDAVEQACGTGSLS